MNPSDSGLPETPTHADIDSLSTRRRRPFGLYAILVLLSVQTVLGVVLAAFLGIGMTVAAADIWAVMAPQAWSLLESLGIMLATAVVVVGLWRYRLWAWYGMLLLLAYGDLDGDGVDDAVALLVENSGGSGSFAQG